MEKNKIKKSKQKISVSDGDLKKVRSHPIRRGAVFKTNPLFNIISKLPPKLLQNILKQTKGDRIILKSLREMSHNYFENNLSSKKVKK